MPPDMAGINETLMLLIRRKIFADRVRALEITLRFPSRHSPFFIFSSSRQVLSN